MAEEWEKVDVPRGAYVGWGNKKGQHVTGTVLDFDPTGGTDFNSKECPVLEVELTEKAASFNKDGERVDFDPGENVMLTCGQVSLKRAVKKADPKRGDMVKITLESLVKVTNGTVKEFGIQIKRGAGSISTTNSEPADDDSSSDAGDDEPPF